MNPNKKKVVILSSTWVEEKAKLLAEKGLEVKHIVEQKEDLVLAELPSADFLIPGLRPITRQDMQRASRLLIVAVIGVGYNHVDLEAATELGIYVTHNPGTNSDAVAEFTFGLLLALSRQIPDAWEDMKKGGWRGAGTSCSEIRGKTLGIIGLGRIGSRVSRIGGGFGMKVLACDPYIPEQNFRDAGAQAVTRDQAISQADFLTIHTPLTEETRKMIGDRELVMMKPTAFLINTARGEIVQPQALRKALDDGILAGAALDVFEKEPPVDFPLTRHPKVILTPHIAGLSLEARSRMSLGSVEQVLQVLQGQKPSRALNDPKNPRMFKKNP
jgi:D-3-phosphoglycerate dehydrogenase / 2-oxoglutarate reductase